MTFKRKQLLGFDTNAKTVKGEQLGFLTGILYLAPSDISGYQVCPMAKLAQCDKACLYSAGRGAFNSVQQSRIDKTLYFFEDRDNFMIQLAKNIGALIKKAHSKGLKPLVRLNGTSDIRWETITVANTGLTLFEMFPDIQFYDYTKDVNRKDLPANYDLTFSYSGVETFSKYVEQAQAKHMRMAVVFRDAGRIPSMFKGIQVVSGDNSDVRHLDEQGVIVGLYAKGQAKRDNTGFVVHN